MATKAKHRLDDRLDLRINADSKRELLQRAESVGRSWQSLLREFIDAYNDNKLKISVSKSKLKQTRNLYNVN